MAQQGTGGTGETEEARMAELLISVIDRDGTVTATIRSKPGTVAAVLDILAKDRRAGPGVLLNKDEANILASERELQPDEGPFKYLLQHGDASGSGDAGAVYSAGAFAGSSMSLEALVKMAAEAAVAAAGAVGGAQLGAGAGAGSSAGRLLPFDQAIIRPMSALGYTHILTASTRQSSGGQVPGKLERWEEFDPGAMEFIKDRCRQAPTAPLFKPPQPAAELSENQRHTRLLMRGTTFAFVQQMGGHAGLPVIGYSWTPQDLADAKMAPFKSNMDEGWVWLGPQRLIVAVVAKQAFALPFRPGWEFEVLYNMSEDEARAAKVLEQRRSVQRQLQQLLGYMRKERLRFGVLYSDVAFWFFFDDIASGALKISRCYSPAQAPPVTLVVAILYMGHLAVKAARNAGTQSPGSSSKRSGARPARDDGSGLSAGSCGSVSDMTSTGEAPDIGDGGRDGSSPRACFGSWTDCRAVLFNPSASSATSPSARLAPLLATTATSAAAQQPAAGAQAAAGLQAAAGAVGMQAGAQPAAGAHESVLWSLKLGRMISRGSTGAVYEARIPDNPSYPDRFAVKVALPGPEGRGSEGGAVRRLLHELDVYQGALADLQGVAVPHVLGYGVLELGSEPEWQPFIVLPLLGPSLRDLEESEQPLLPEQGRAILAALDQLHGTGVLHGDVRLANIVLPLSTGGNDSEGSVGSVGGDGRSSQPLFLDFSHAQLFEPAQPQALAASGWTFGREVRQERDVCEELLESLQEVCSTHMRSMTTQALPAVAGRACVAAPVLRQWLRPPARLLVRRAAPSALVRRLHCRV